MRALILVLAAACLLWIAADGWWAHAVAWAFEQQRGFHRDLSQALRDTVSGDAAGWVLVGVSLGYGIFHAAGPGHGKAVIATYLLTQESRLMRAVRLAVAASFVQGSVAIVLTYGLIYLAAWLPRDTQAAVAWSERLSFALLAVLGFWLAFRGLRRLVAFFARDRLTPGCSSHGAGCRCTHVIAPDPRVWERPAGWRESLAIVLSIGLRPCSGAVLVLVLAKAMGSPMAGLAAVAAMATGTAATVTALAVLTLGARKWTASLAENHAARLAFGTDLVAVVGGGIIAAVASSLLAASLGQPHPLGL